MPILRLAIACPLRQLFDYTPPPDLNPDTLELLKPGVRLLVPFGRRQVTAILVETAAESALPADKLRAAVQLLDTEPVLTQPLLQLCQWAATYYKHPLGEILFAALPAQLRRGTEHNPAGTRQWRLSDAGKGLPAGALRRAPKQAQLLSLLQSQPALSDAEIASQGISRAVLRQLADKSIIESVDSPLRPRPGSSASGLELSPEQRTALSAINSHAAGFSCHLLDGVTGSGKTEVYLQLIAQVVEAGRQALVLVPEIGLTPQTLSRFRERFDAEIAVLHSGHTDAARLKAWEAARSGRAHIVIGTRSAIFTPLLKPGVIIVDEEHDASFKQQDGFRYSARDIAVKRAQLEEIPVLLGSATPSLESMYNAQQGRYQHLFLRERAGAGVLPEIATLDLRKQHLQGGMSAALLDAVSAELAAGNQVLLFLNRRGYAPTLQCHDCGYVAGCKHCDAHLTWHRAAGQLRCHHCDWRCAVPRACPDCRSSQLAASGVGTEQTEQVLTNLFPAVPVFRVDRDSMRTKGALEAVTEQVNLGKPCLLLGTQMLTKGHHFPGITLVGLLDSDAALFSADFRGPERMGQLLTQVAGRAGREDKTGRVLIQTHYPDHPLLNALLQGGYQNYAQQLLEERRQGGLPPFGQLLLVRADARNAQAAEQFLSALRRQLEQRYPGGAQLIGPLPAPLQRKQNRYRMQLLASSSNRGQAQALAAALISTAESLPEAKSVQWSLDVDPQDMT
ncbi:primosomal protein N' [Halieaceae bacterium IMCC14734]|uniref:Replication restart protein PriA n=1 Tax=Candidatus Litorirhabdus singularis TaxID=2518993 RepID=A0ABT3TBW5_9GAMM|nr:primosomal protein N' [Candidatus Litorirhabdus singularis]MCX2979782.1 primosomal protein N' [Candidatus Litorirhabdus singularis]